MKSKCQFCKKYIGDVEPLIDPTVTHDATCDECKAKGTYRAWEQPEVNDRPWEKLYQKGKCTSVLDRVNEAIKVFEWKSEEDNTGEMGARVNMLKVIKSELESYPNPDGNWLTGSILPETTTCFISKYLPYAHMDKAPDDILNDIYAEVLRLKNLQDYGYSQAPPKVDTEQVSRLDKVLAVEEMATKIHGYGTVFDRWSYSDPGADRLSFIILEMLFEGKLG